MNEKTIAIDWDGVIYSYTSGHTQDRLGAGTFPDDPVPGAIAFLRELIASGYKVAIFSCRLVGGNPMVRDLTKHRMVAWLESNGLQTGELRGVEFTGSKPHAEIYIDDRGFQFRGMFPTIEYLENFKPWHEKKVVAI